jgi:hypothetical protein
MAKLMTLDALKDAYEGGTGTASENGRKLAYVGFAVIWIFKLTLPNGDPQIPRALWLPAVFLAVALLLDLFQYLLTGVVYFAYFRRKEKEFSELHKQDPSLAKDTWTFTGSTRATWPGWTVFFLKQIALAVGWALLVVFLTQRLPTSDSPPPQPPDVRATDTSGTGPRDTGGTGPRDAHDAGLPRGTDGGR